MALKQHGELGKLAGADSRHQNIVGGSHVPETLQAGLKPTHKSAIPDGGEKVTRPSRARSDAAG
jgi:hypothetical protein